MMYCVGSRVSMRQNRDALCGLMCLRGEIGMRYVITRVYMIDKASGARVLCMIEIMMCRLWAHLFTYEKIVTRCKISIC